MALSIRQIKEKAATVSSLVGDIRNELPDSELAETLDDNYDQLYSMILEVAETLDCIISDIEK